MSTFDKHIAADRRLTILQLLAASSGYRMNASTLRDALPGFGHSVSEDAIHNDLAWLAEQGLVTNKEFGELTIATLSARGLDVQADRAWVPGIKRPRPSE